MGRTRVFILPLIAGGLLRSGAALFLLADTHDLLPKLPHCLLSLFSA